MSPTQLDQYETIGKSILAEKMESFVNRNAPIEFVMLGFPFKSTNKRDKVIGDLPDLGEEVTLRNFAKFNESIKETYSPGVKIAIASDGYIFNDLLGVEDNTVLAYKEVSLELSGGTPVEFYDLNDFYDRNSSTSSHREKVMKQFGTSPEKLQEEIMLNPDTNLLYRGMIRFMTEELATRSYVSASQSQKAAKILTRQMMLRNEAWSNLVKKEFANHIRLSMHQSVNNGNKYSFKLIPGEKAVHSAWHCAIFWDGNEYVTLHKKDAEEMGLHLVYVNGRPYYYEPA